MAWAQAVTTGALLTLVSCGATVASDEQPDPPAPEYFAPALQAGLKTDWPAMVRRTHGKVGPVDEAATAEQLSRAVVPLVDDGMLFMTRADIRTACLCETTVTDQGPIREDGTFDLTLDHRPAWLLVYDDVLFMTPSPQTVLVIIDPESGTASVKDIPFAPPAPSGPD